MGQPFEGPFHVNEQTSKTSSHWFSSILQVPRSGKSLSENYGEEKICFVDAVDVSWLITFDCFWQPHFPLHYSGQQSSILVETLTNLTYFCSCCYFGEQFIPGSFQHQFPSSSCLLTPLGMISLYQLQAHSSQYPSFFHRSLRCGSFSCL